MKRRRAARGGRATGKRKAKCRQRQITGGSARCSDGPGSSSVPRTLAEANKGRVLPREVGLLRVLQLLQELDGLLSSSSDWLVFVNTTNIQKGEDLIFVAQYLLTQMRTD